MKATSKIFTEIRKTTRKILTFKTLQNVGIIGQTIPKPRYGRNKAQGYVRDA